MVNETRQRSIPNWQRQAWLTEYQACQHDISSSGQSYWTIAGIFIGISSVLLGGIIYGALANNGLVELFIEEMKTDSTTPEKLWVLRIMIAILGIGIIIIFYCLRRWLKRVVFLQQINFHRMRDIERELGMWKSWRVHGVDNWILRNEDFKNKISDGDKNRLKGYQPHSYEPLEFWRYWRTKPQYGDSSAKLYDWIFGILIFLWLCLTLSVFIPLVPFCTILCSVIALLIAIGLALLIVCSTRFRQKE